MKLSLIATQPLHPFLERMRHLYAPDADLVCLPWQAEERTAFLHGYLAQASGYDGLLLLDGAFALPEEGLAAGSCPLVIPRVHNCVSLLLGGAGAYRNLFERHCGVICWSLPESGGIFFTPKADCTCLCHLTDTELGLRDDSLIARAEAVRQGWDYFQTACDYTLLKQLLSGDWDAGEILLVKPGTRAEPAYTQELIGAE